MPLSRRGKSKVWQMSFHVNGKQVRRSTGTMDKRVAERIYAKLKTRLAEEEWFDFDEGKKRTFEELAEKYEQQVGKEQKSWISARSYFMQLKEFFGAYTLSKITPALIDDFKQLRKAKGVKPATINRQLNILKRMLNLARKRWQWLKEVPVIEMELNADKKRVRHLSFDEFHRLLDSCDDWLKDLVSLAAWTGLRQGNVLHLKRAQVNLSARTITIEGDTMKNGEPLIIPLAEPAYEVLVNALQVVRIDSSYVFCNSDGKPFYNVVVRRAFNRATEKAKLKDFRYHDLRHCYASWTRQAGVDLDTLADLLGHKDTRMTRRYAHITPAHLRGAVELLEASYSNSSTKPAHFKEKGISN